MINTGKTYKSLQEALEVLNSSVISRGEEIVLPYYSESKDDIDVVVAIGTSQGVGPGCYSLMSTEGVQIVDFVTDKPDSSSLMEGQLYIWTDPFDNNNYRIYLSGKERVIERVKGDLFVSDRLGNKYYVTKSMIRKFSDFITSGDIEKYGSTKFMSKEEYEVLPGSEKANKGNIFFICKKA